MALMPFLFVSAANAGKIWLMRTLGEEAYMAVLVNAVHKSKLLCAVRAWQRQASL